MKYLLLGAGKMGKAIAYDLIYVQKAEKLILANRHIEKAEKLKKWLCSIEGSESVTGNDIKNNTEKIEIVEADVDDSEKLVQLMSGVDCVICAVAYQYNYLAATAAIKAGVPYCDLGQNVDIVDKEFTLTEQAEAKNITMIPDGGVAPGMVNIVAAHAIKNFTSVDQVLMRVGGLPRYPKPPLNYAVTWSVHGLINEYIEKARILRNGEFLEVDSLSELETITFHYPFNKMEAFITSGGSSTLPRTYQGKINELNYKTIRYPNHYHIMRAFLDLGFTNQEPVKVNGKAISPRLFLEKLLKEKLRKDHVDDVILLRVTVTGKKLANKIGTTNKDKNKGENSGTNEIQAKETYEMIDYYDPETGLTAMMRCTGFSLAIVAGMIAEKKIKRHGVLTQEESIPTDLYLSELEKRGIKFLCKKD